MGREAERKFRETRAAKVLMLLALNAVSGPAAAVQLQGNGGAVLQTESILAQIVADIEAEYQEVVVIGQTEDTEEATGYQDGQVVEFPSEKDPSKTISITLEGQQKLACDSNGKAVIMDHNVGTANTSLETSQAKVITLENDTEVSETDTGLVQTSATLAQIKVIPESQDGAKEVETAET